jgi:hypothetical protein
VTNSGAINGMSDAEFLRRSLAELEQFRVWARQSFTSPDLPEPATPVLDSANRRRVQRDLVGDPFDRDAVLAVLHQATGGRYGLANEGSQTP